MMSFKMTATTMMSLNYMYIWRKKKEKEKYWRLKWKRMSQNMPNTLNKMKMPVLEIGWNNDATVSTDKILFCCCFRWTLKRSMVNGIWYRNGCTWEMMMWFWRYERWTTNILMKWPNLHLFKVTVIIFRDSFKRFHFMLSGWEVDECVWHAGTDMDDERIRFHFWLLYFSPISFVMLYFFFVFVFVSVIPNRITVGQTSLLISVSGKRDLKMKYKIVWTILSCMYTKADSFEIFGNRWFVFGT